MTKQIELPALPFAIFDEFGKGCEDRVADHYNAAIAAHEEARVVGEPVAWLIDWPDEPELGDYFAHEPVPPNVGRSRPLYLASLPAPQVAQAGMVLVPKRMTQAMRDVVDTEGWTWEDLLAAAEAITKAEYATLAAPVAQPATEQRKHYETQPDGTVNEVDPVDMGTEAEQAEKWAKHEVRIDDGVKSVSIERLRIREDGTPYLDKLTMTDRDLTDEEIEAEQRDTEAEQAEAPSDIEDAKEELAALFFQCARYERPSTDWRAALDAFCNRLATKPTASNAGEREIQPDDLTIETWPPSPKTGMIFGTSKGVKLTHRPTGVSVTCDSERSQHLNRGKAYEQLRAALASKPAGEQKPVSHVGLSTFAWGVTRMGDNPKAVLVSFRSEPTDDDLRALHEALRPASGRVVHADSAQPEQVAQDREHAENYRWLLSWGNALYVEFGRNCEHGPELDAAIRAARARGEVQS